MLRQRSFKGVFIASENRRGNPLSILVVRTLRKSNKQTAAKGHSKRRKAVIDQLARLRAAEDIVAKESKAEVDAAEQVVVDLRAQLAVAESTFHRLRVRDQGRHHQFNTACGRLTSELRQYQSPQLGEFVDELNRLQREIQDATPSTSTSSKTLEIVDKAIHTVTGYKTERQTESNFPSLQRRATAIAKAIQSLNDPKLLELDDESLSKRLDEIRSGLPEVTANRSSGNETPIPIALM